MNTTAPQAYRVLVATAGSQSEHYAVGSNMAAAAADAQAALAPGTTLVRIEEVGRVLSARWTTVSPAAPRTEEPAPAAASAAPVARSRGPGRAKVAPTKAPAPPQAEARAHAPHGQRQEQLRAFLVGHGGEGDIDDIMVALQVNRGNAKNVVVAGVKAGLVERIGERSGRCRLVVSR